MSDHRGRLLHRSEARLIAPRCPGRSIGKSEISESLEEQRIESLPDQSTRSGRLAAPGALGCSPDASRLVRRRFVRTEYRLTLQRRACGQIACATPCSGLGVLAALRNGMRGF